MAAVLTGTPVSVNFGTSSNPAGQSVTIPADATAVYVFFQVWASGQNAPVPTSMTLAGEVADQSAFISSSESTEDGAGVYAWYNPPTGSQTLDPDWGISVGQGPIVAVAFVKNGNLSTWRDADTDGATGAGPVSVTLTTEPDDLVLKFDMRDTTSAPSLSADWTSLLTDSNNNSYFRLSSIVATGTSQVCNSEDEAFSHVVAISIGPSAEVGDTFSTRAVVTRSRAG